MDGYMGEVKMFAGNYPPANWAYCQGQMLAINQYQSLYSIIGVTYGGDGRSTFGLPDLRGRMPIGPGTGPGLSNRTAGQTGGYERINLTVNQLPPHSHTVKCDTTSGMGGVSNTPENNLAGINAQGTSYGPTESSSLMKSDMINNTGQGDSITNMSPWICTNYIICLNGLYPPRS